MKQLRLTFDNGEYKIMKKIKGDLSWHDFFLLLTTHAKESIKKGDLEIFKKEAKNGKQ